MADGTTLSLTANVITGSARRPRLLAVAGHHGDEQEGPAALITLWQQLQPQTLYGSLVMVPVLNPPAFQAVRRTSYEDQLDMNRIFPGSPQGTVTERLAHAFCGQLAPRADLILSMHGWSAGYLVEPYVEYPRSGKVSEKSRLAASAFGLPLVNPLEAGPGRLLTEASNLGVPIIEVEIGGQATSLPARRALYETGTLNLLRHLGILHGRARRSPGPRAVDRTEIFAPAGGMLRTELAVGSRVRKGQTLATIFDLNLRPLTAVTSPQAGVLGVARLAASVLPGQLVATIFTQSRGANLRD
jgi:N2-acetyl-L-2,4-diaminobutanoate deacetylase